MPNTRAGPARAKRQQTAMQLTAETPLRHLTSFRVQRAHFGTGNAISPPTHIWQVFHFLFWNNDWTSYTPDINSHVSRTKWRWKTLEIVTFRCKILESDKSGAQVPAPSLHSSANINVVQSHTSLWDSPSTRTNGDGKAYLSYHKGHVREPPSWW